MIVDKDANVIGVADCAVCDPRPCPLPVDVDAGPTERSVGEVAVVDGYLALLWHTETVLSNVRGVFRGIKLEREREINTWSSNNIALEVLHIYTCSRSCDMCMFMTNFVGTFISMLQMEGRAVVVPDLDSCFTSTTV